MSSIPPEAPEKYPTLKLIAAILLVVYVQIGLCCAIYWNYRVAVDHGFVVWLFFGELWATFKGIFWPIFIFIG